MASLDDTVSKEVVPSDGDDHQLQGELIRQLLTTEISQRNLSNPGRSEHGSTHYSDLNLYRRILTDNNSLSGHSDIESSAGAEHHATPSTWLENEEQVISTERRRPVVNRDLTLANIRLFNNLNEHSWQNLRKTWFKNEEQGKLFDNDISDTLRLADVPIEDKSAALRDAAPKEKSLREECLRIKIENDKLKTMQSQSAAIHSEVTMKFDSELQSMTADCNEPDHQLRDSKLMIRLDIEEYEKHLDTDNQHSMAFPKFSNPNKDKALTGRLLVNSTELPGHSHGATMMSKVQHRMSDITRNPIAN